MRQTVLNAIAESKLITIVRGLGPEPMEKLAQALYLGGIRMIEVTFDQSQPGHWKDTAAAIRLIHNKFKGAVLAGAGTVMTREQLKIAHEAGAQYIISPNVDEGIIRMTRELGLVSLPGALTPTEIAAAHAYGADIVKVFPAGCLGSGYIKAVKAPLPHIQLMAVGGVSQKNAADFIQAGVIGLGVGGNLVNKEWILAGEFERITELAKEYGKAVRM